VRLRSAERDVTSETDKRIVRGDVIDIAMATLEAITSSEDPSLASILWSFLGLN
jgi:hypothetical protein